MAHAAGGGPGAVRPPRLLPRLLGVAAASAAVGLLLLLSPFGERGDVVVGTGSVLAAAALALAASVARVRGSARARPWQALAAMALCFLLAETYWFAMETVLRRPVPAASAADGLYYLGYAFLLAAAVAFAEPAGWARRLRRLVDIAVTGSILLALAWILVLRDLALAGGASLGAALVTAAYPALDLALAAALLRLAADARGALRRRLLLVGAGVLAWTVSDFAYAYLSVHSDYASGVPLDAAWVAGYLLVALAARVEGPQTQPAAGPASSPTTALVYGPLAVLLPVAAADYLATRHMDALLFSIGLVMVAGLGARQVLYSVDLLRQNAQLERHKALLDEAEAIAKIGSWELDLGTGAVRGTVGAHRVLGLEPGAVSDAAVLSRLHPDDGGRPRPRTDGTPYAELHRLALPDGAPRWIEVRGRTVFDRSGRPLRSVGTCQDVTEERLAREAVRRSEERYQRLLDNLTEGFFSIDPRGARVLVASRACADVFGVPLGRIEDDPWAVLAAIHPDDQPEVLDAVRRVVRHAERVRLRYRVVDADGRTRWIASDVHPAVEGGAVVRIDGHARDVTAEVDAQEARDEARRLQEIADFRTRFLNAAAHELANPITPLRLQLASLRKGSAGPLSERQRSGIELLERNVQRLGLLVQDLLQAARLEGGRLPIKPAPVDLAQLFQDVRDTFDGQATETGVRLDVLPPPAAPLVADGARLMQVLFNLVHNALKFTPRGGRVLVAAEPAGPELVLRVTDTGLGLSPEQRARLFQPFSQVHDAPARRAGTGLGLYIAKGIVEQHHGTIDAASPGPGEGTTFAVRLPLRPPPGAAAREALREAHGGREAHAAQPRPTPPTPIPPHAPAAPERARPPRPPRATAGRRPIVGSPAKPPAWAAPAAGPDGADDALRT